jgi:MFS family permease
METTNGPSLYENQPRPQIGFVERSLPCVLAFTASACIMIVELVAGRLIARHVGSSLYTWTSVIGVVLAGITVGNLVGGWLADRFDPRKLCSALFVFAALACAVIPAIDYLVSEIDTITDMSSWPLRIATHVAIVFFPSSLVLGLIGPVVAKMALDQGRAMGRTVGNVYAWGALGSIVGTFVTGFYLIALVGTKMILLYVAAFLAVVGLALAPLYSAPLAIIFIAGGLFAYQPMHKKIWDWKPEMGFPYLRETRDVDWVYAAESQYSFVKVDQQSKGTRELILDFLIHAYLPKKITDLEYDYEEIYAAVTHRCLGDRKDLKALFLGGGGFIFPRYLRAYYPESWLEVAEIDPGVTRANLTAFGLLPEEVDIVGDPDFLKDLPEPIPMPPDKEEDDGENEVAKKKKPKSEASDEPDEDYGGSGKPRTIRTPKLADRTPLHPIKVFHLDARQHVEDLVRLKRSGAPFEPFDVIYGDAFNHYSVPFHLVTHEFNEKLKEILRPETGLYMINVIDIYHSGLFIGSILNTLRETFPHVYILPNNEGGPDEREDGRDTFIAIGAFREIEMENLGDELGGKEIKASVLEPEHLRTLEERSSGVVLRDDYSPVENLLEPVIRASR